MGEIGSLAADVLTFGTLLALVLGTGFGIVVGALPGLGSVVGLSICLPFTFGMAAREEG